VLVAEVMTSAVITAEPDMDVEEAAEKMIRHGVRRLVVVAAGQLAGVVTLDDIASRTGDRASELSARITRAAMPDSFSHARGET
jgi:CBS domain-containing protein